MTYEEELIKKFPLLKTVDKNDKIYLTFLLLGHSSYSDVRDKCIRVFDVSVTGGEVKRWFKAHGVPLNEHFHF